MKSLETIAREGIEKYMRPYPQLGMKGFSLDVAVKKAKAARIGWDDIFDKVGAQMKGQVRHD